jgi:hypothetical protein
MAKNPKSVAAGKKAWNHVEDWNISEVLADLPHAVEIGPHSSKKALKIKIWSGKEHIGTLHIAKGGVQWTYRKSKYPRLSWRQFAEKMTA